MGNYRNGILEKLSKETDPLKKIDLENEYAFDLQDEVEKSLNLSYDILEKCKTADNGRRYEKGTGYANGNIGIKLLITGEPEKGYDHLEKALEIFQELNLSQGIGFIKMLFANYYWGRGEVNKGMELAIEVSTLIDETWESAPMGWCYYFIGTFHADLNNNRIALENLLKSKEYFESVNYDNGLARIYNGLTVVYSKLNEIEKAIDCANHSLKLHKESNRAMGIARSLNDLGVLYASAGNFNHAVTTLKESLQLRKESLNKQAVITTLTELAETYFKFDHLKEAEEYYEEARALAYELSAKVKLVRILLGLINVYKSKGEFEKALKIYDEVYALKSEVLHQDSESRVKSIEDKFNIEKKEKETEIYRLKNVELKSAYSQIEEKNKDITDSIQYAKRIQEAILPKTEVLNNLFSNHFILYQPKDIVSGDFYWAAEKNGIKLLAAVDCTGHGVPGAFMSMIGYSLLNEIVLEKGITNPGEILSKLSEGITRALHQTGREGESRDGMDISLIAIDKEKNKLFFAGANNPLWMIENTNGTKTFTEIKGDKKPIGFHFGNDNTYKTHELEINPNTSYYIFTDGFADQFGGPLGKKFKYKNLKEHLESITEQPLDKQKDFLRSTFENWKSNLEQVDDVLIACVRAV